MSVTTVITDASGETSNFSTPIDPANLPSQTQLDALQTALGGIGIGTIGDQTQRVESVVNQGSTDLPTNKFAQRELKWLISFTSNGTNKIYTREYPCPDATLLPTGSDNLDLGGTAAAAFVTAFEAFASVKEGSDQNGVTATTISLVGRKN